ncbi:hypothetical protein AGR1B_Cc140260 [Agrobacterium fabacearum S56]|nr:hypothetical protein AGR1B_Cc140260 [Agrobacterium fabacearum S56]
MFLRTCPSASSMPLGPFIGLPLDYCCLPPGRYAVCLSFFAASGSVALKPHRPLPVSCGLSP